MTGNQVSAILSALDAAIRGTEQADDLRSYSQGADPFERGYANGLRAARRIVADMTGAVSQPPPLTELRRGE